MVHAVMADVQPGEVIVLTMPEPRPVALVGDLLATQAQVAGAAAILVDAAIRDVEELAEMGLPIWARWIRVKGAQKETAGKLNVPVMVGRATINPGDVLVLDADGVAVVPQIASRRFWTHRWLARRRSASSARSSRPATSHTTSTVCAPSWRHNDERTRPPDIAHLGPIELLTPKPQESLDFFIEMMGMELQRQEGQSVYPARLGRLPDLVAEADRGPAVRHGILRLSHLEPGGVGAPRGADRADRPGSRLGGAAATSASAAPTASRTPTVTTSRSTTRSSAT